MGLKIASYVFFIIVISIARKEVKAQYYFRGILHTSPRNNVHTYNNWKQVGYKYVNGNIMPSYIAPSIIQFSDHGDSKTTGDYCNTEHFSGVCTLASKCPQVVKDIRNGKNPVVCSYHSYEAIVCCPKGGSQSNNLMWPNTNNNQLYYQSRIVQQNNRIYPTASPIISSRQHPQIKPKVQQNRNSKKRRSQQKCEAYSKLGTHSRLFTSLSVLTSTQELHIPSCTYATRLIVGGDAARPGEFPHMAAIGWSGDSDVDWRCGGSLISEYHILTVAHCSSFFNLPPDIVRLGDKNLVKQDNSPQWHDYEIENITVHPDYRPSSNYHDIALIRIKGQISFTKFIRPACLWQNYKINATKVIATGWGQLDFSGDRSDDLRKVALNIVDNSQCQKLYEKTNKLKNGIVNSQLCAGYLNGGKDTCLGDSGGPIQLVTPQNQCVFHVIGLTSFGKSCAAVNTAGVYTRVSSYLDWIESHVWP